MNVTLIVTRDKISTKIEPTGGEMSGGDVCWAKKTGPKATKRIHNCRKTNWQKLDKKVKMNDNIKWRWLMARDTKTKKGDYTIVFKVNQKCAFSFLLPCLQLNDGPNSTRGVRR